jgi:SSS family solute:Na+ symporter
VVFWLMFDVCTTFTGLYARAALPGIDARLAYPLLAEMLLPVGLKGLFFAGVLATIMSTVDSYCFVGAMTLAHDLFRRTLRPGASAERVVLVTRLGILATAGLAMALALGTGGSIKAIWKTLGSLSSAAMLVPVLIGFTGWRPPGAAATSMIGGSIGTLGWAALRRWGPVGASRLEPMIPGVALSLCGYALCALRGGRPDE